MEVIAVQDVHVRDKYEDRVGDSQKPLSLNAVKFDRKGTIQTTKTFPCVTLFNVRNIKNSRLEHLCDHTCAVKAILVIVFVLFTICKRI